MGIAALVGCRDGEDDDVGASETAEANVQMSPTVVVADTAASNAIEVLADSLRIPADVGARFANLPVGTIFVGDRAKGTAANEADASTGTNGDAGAGPDAGDGEQPDGGATDDAGTDAGAIVDYRPHNPHGFLRRIESVQNVGGIVVMTTKAAALTDAVLNGAIYASSGGARTIDPNALRTTEGFSIDADFGKTTLFENEDEVKTPKGKTRFQEAIAIESGVLHAEPAVEIDLNIVDGKVARFMSRVVGKLEASIRARAEVKATGALSEDTERLLRAIPHDVTKPVFKSERVPLPTFFVGEIPVSTSVEFTVSVRCHLEFGGPLVASAGVDTRSFVRLAAVQTNGVWEPPTPSEFEITPSFQLEKGGSSVDVRCALETDAKLSAYDSDGLTMTVAPYIDFTIGPPRAMTDYGRMIGQSGPNWFASAGATGRAHGSADVFGVGPLDQPLADWRAPRKLFGPVP